MIATSPAPPIITFSGETSTLSPNGDGQDDTIDVITYVDQLIAIAINITTSTGTHVRNLPRYADVTRCGGDDSNPSFCTESRWDGLDDAGVLAPDGNYLLVASAVGSDGNTTTASTPITINTATAGTLTAPTSGATLAGTSTFTFTPDPRFAGGTITAVDVRFFPRSGAQPCSLFSALLLATNSGTWQAEADTTWCRQGSGSLSTSISYVDTRGNSRTYLASIIDVFVSNPAPARVLVAGGNRTFSPNGDGSDETIRVTAFVDEPADLALNITTSTGTTVRNLRSAARVADCNAPPNVIRDGRYCDSHLWDGRNDAGVVAPDGVYLVVATAVDDDGNMTTARTPVTINTNSPGTLTTPTTGSDLKGTVTLIFTPDSRFIGGTITGVDAKFVGLCKFGLVASFALATTGEWQAVVDTTRCWGPGTLDSFVNYTDAFGNNRRIRAGSIIVSASNPPPPPRINFLGGYGPFSPNGDGLDDTIDITVIADEPATVTTRITTQAGTSVRSTLPESNFEYCVEPIVVIMTDGGTCASVTWDGLDDAGAPAPDGVYLLVASAVDSDSNITIATKPITLNTAATPPIEIPETPNAILLSICAGGWLAVAGRRRRAVHRC